LGQNFSKGYECNISIQMKNGVACKNKWVAVAGDFKKIYDYKFGT
jgi:hypothetical protein